MTPESGPAHPGPGTVLVVNTGSSSVKLRLLDADDDTVATHDVGSWDGSPAAAGVGEFVAGLPAAVDAVGHRVVHGGDDDRGAAVLDDDERARIGDLTDLAPLHQPQAVAGIDAAVAALPGVPQVACFDTAFHRTMPAAASTYALPQAWRSRWPVHRYGFHGLSHSYAVTRAAELVGRPAGDLRMVTLHLGAGASAAAVVGGRCVDTTMGFTPLEGLVMATRSGSVDPGLLPWLLRRGLSLDSLERGLTRASGLAGLSGTSGDMREVVAAAAGGDERAGLARAVYTHRLVRETAAMTGSAGGLDVLVFTGGVGEHDPALRREVCTRLAYLDVAVDTDANETADGDADVTADGSGVQVVVVASREDLQIAREVRRLLSASR